MADYLYNISRNATVVDGTSSSAAAAAATASGGPASGGNVAVAAVSFSLTGHVGVIVILSALVFAGILFFVCGLLLKAEAHLSVEREIIQGGLLTDSLHKGIDEL